ncbi:MAG: response regulator transcription factor [Bacteroidaceae bacterium]|nr:response regulator transcription factor [Bacteroidaceae bacterium]
MSPSHEIAIIDPNTLSCIGLENMIETLFPQVTIRSFNSFSQLTDDTPDMYVHYFVAAQILLEHTAFFLERRRKTIVLANGQNQILTNFLSIDIQQPEKELVRSLLQLYQGGHPHPTPSKQHTMPDTPLTAREIEVLTLIVKGFINKEIAEQLNISLTTVISHRKNLMEKTGIRSVSGLTIYAVMNGFVEVTQI